jgi:outer membrane protein
MGLKVPILNTEYGLLNTVLPPKLVDLSQPGAYHSYTDFGEYFRRDSMDAQHIDPRKRLSRRLAPIMVLFLSGVLVPHPCSAQTVASAELLTLKKAIETALKNQPTIEAQTGQVRSGEAKIGQARGNYYPHLSLGGAYSRIGPVGSQTSASTSNAGLPSGSYIPSGNQPYDQYAATANLTQLLFDFGKTGAQVGVQKMNTEAARLELENTRQQVIFNVKQAYFSLLSAQRNRDVAFEAVQQFNKHLEYARALFRVGAKPKFDVTKAEVDLSNAEVSLIKAENDVRLTRVALNNAMGLPDAKPYSVEEDFSSVRAELSFENALQVALERRPDLLSLQRQKESARESIKAAQRAHYPTLSGSASAMYVGTAFPLDNGWTAGLNMALPLFTGFVTSYQVAEAQAALMVVSANERNLKQTVVLELQQGFLSLREATERMRSTEIAVRQARENLELANERYAAGLAIGVEVTDAVFSHANAQLANIAAHYDRKIAEARIDKATGNNTQ